MRAVKNVNTVSTTQGLHSEENVQQVTAVNQQNSSVGKTPPDVAEVALNEEKWPQELQQESVVMDIISGQKPVAGQSTIFHCFSFFNTLWLFRLHLRSIID